MDKTVSVIKCPDYDAKALDQAVERHFQMLGLERLIRPQMKIVLKPNLLMKRRPEEATTTHPALMAAIIRKLKALGAAHITIADSPGGPFTTGMLAGIYSASGMERVAMEEEVALNQDTTATTVLVGENEQIKQVDVITAIAKADLVINVCKLKAHGMMTLSGAVKNMFGVIPGLTKPEYHFRFPDPKDFGAMLVDVCEAAKPAVTFVDGIEAMEGNGPSAGQKKQVGLVLAGRSPYCVDLALCYLTGLDPMELPSQTAAIGRGLSPASFAELTVVGDALVPVEFIFPAGGKSLDFSSYVPQFLRPWARRLMTPKPVVRQPDCIGCGKCKESCPVNTIAIEDKKARILDKKCIRCYCCHEMCPVKAIDLKRTFFMGIRGAE